MPYQSVKTTCMLTIATLLLTGCAWVKLKPAGEKVRVLEAQEITTCDELGKTHSSLINKIAGFNRNPEKVKKELEILARNSAASMGGDTVVPVSEIIDGEQSFAVYKCVGVARK